MVRNEKIKITIMFSFNQHTLLAEFKHTALLVKVFSEAEKSFKNSYNKDFLVNLQTKFFLSFFLLDKKLRYLDSGKNCRKNSSTSNLKQTYPVSLEKVADNRRD